MIDIVEKMNSPRPGVTVGHGPGDQFVLVQLLDLLHSGVRHTGHVVPAVVGDAVVVLVLHPPVQPGYVGVETVRHGPVEEAP